MVQLATRPKKRAKSEDQAGQRRATSKALREQWPHHRARNNRDKRCEFEDSVSPGKQFVGSSSGSKPYLDGPKKAACVLARKMTAKARAGLPWAKANVAKIIAAASEILVPMVTLRLLNRSAKNPQPWKTAEKAAQRGFDHENQKILL